MQIAGTSDCSEKRCELLKIAGNGAISFKQCSIYIKKMKASFRNSYDLQE